MLDRNRLLRLDLNTSECFKHQCLSSTRDGSPLLRRFRQVRSLWLNERRCLPSMHAQRGQAMTEYLIIVALIAVAAIAVYQSFGQVIRAQTAGLARELAGESASQAVDAARTASGDALKQKRLKSLKSYGAQKQ